MIIKRKNFPSLLKDNEETYFKYLEGIISSIDELSSMEITKTITGYTFRIACSTPQYSIPLLQEIIKFHKFLGMHIDISKSVKSSLTIFFGVEVN